MKTLITLLLLSLFQFVLVLSAETEEVFSPTIQTKAGKVRGHIRTVLDNKKVYFYEGIKFGEAARFSAPKPAPAWTPDVYNATRYRFVCPQPEFKLGDHLSAEAEGERFGNEDCLYLNVWTPVGAFDEHGSSKNLSVMVWIHGGGFLSGSIFNGHYDGRHMAESAQVVVVSVAYRLGVFGFLYGGPGTDAPGNLGLRDQVLALRWVQENIAGFGGDPSQVTIFGQSAGSMSVGALVLSPLADGLFRRAIMMSGAPNSYLGSEPARKSLNKTLDLAEKLHCNNSENSIPKILTCLRGKTAQQLLDSTNLALLDGESFIPVYEDCGDFLPTPPVVELKSGKSFHKKGIDLMFGVTSGEGSGFVVPYLPIINSDQIDLKMTRSALGLLFQIFQLPYYQEVEDFYTKGLNDSDKDSLRRAIASSFGDFHLTCPEIFFAEALAKSSPTSRLFSYRVTQQISRGCRGWMDVCHAEDNTLVFGHPVVEPRRFTAIETKLSADMVRAWTNFAKHGDPGHWEGSGSGSGNGSSSNVQWSGAFAGADHSSVQFMELNAHHYRMVEGFYQKNCDGFWKAKLFA